MGLPAADLPFAQGRLLQHFELPGVWLERGLIDASDTRLMDGALGLAGQRCMATLFFAAGTALDKTRRAAALDMARQVLDGHALRGTAGATCPNPQVLVVRVLSPLVEPAVDLLRQVWVNCTMETTKVGIREFRAGIAEFIASSSPVAVTRHGHTVGYFIPTHGQADADITALKKASKTLGQLLAAHDVDVETVVADFKAVRKQTTASKKLKVTAQ